MPSKEVLDSLQNLHEELEKLEPAIKHVETAVEISNIVKAIPDKHLELIKSLKKIDEEFKKNLSKIFEENVKEINNENKDTLKKINYLAEVISDYHEKLTVLRDAIEVYYKKIASINFPERLDKLDSSISAINIGIQNIQSRFIDFEKALLQIMERNAKGQKVGRIINIGLSFLIIFLVSLLIYRTM